MSQEKKEQMYLATQDQINLMGGRSLEGLQLLRILAVPEGAKVLTRAQVREAMIELNTWPDGTIDLDSIHTFLDELFGKD